MPPASAAWRIRCASALLTASGFSIMTWMRRFADASTIDGMVAGVRERRDRLGLDRVEHRPEIGEERRVGDLVALAHSFAGAPRRARRRRLSARPFALARREGSRSRVRARGRQSQGEAAAVPELVHSAGRRRRRRRAPLETRRGSWWMSSLDASRRFFTSGQVYTAAPWRVSALDLASADPGPVEQAGPRRR